MTEEDYKKTLKEYLGRYADASARKNQLEKRLWSIQEEMDTPIGGCGYKPTPHSRTNTISDKSASFMLRMADIEERILDEKNLEAKCMLEVMEIMDYLGKETLERRILECKYIDVERMEQIASREHMSRKSCYQYMNRGIQELIQFKKVRAILEKEYFTSQEKETAECIPAI